MEKASGIVGVVNGVDLGGGGWGGGRGLRGGVGLGHDGSGWEEEEGEGLADVSLPWAKGTDMGEVERVDVLCFLGGGGGVEGGEGLLVGFLDRGWGCGCGAGLRKGWEKKRADRPPDKGGRMRRGTMRGSVRILSPNTVVVVCSCMMG